MTIFLLKVFVSFHAALEAGNPFEHRRTFDITVL
jgi:hypothetical protein